MPSRAVSALALPSRALPLPRLDCTLSVAASASMCACSEEKTAKKLIDASTFHHAISVERPSMAAKTMGGFGSVLPRHPASQSARMLESTAMASWN